MKPENRPGMPFGQLPTGLEYTGSRVGNKLPQTWNNPQTGQSFSLPNGGMVRPTQGSAWTAGQAQPVQQQTRGTPYAPRAASGPSIGGWPDPTGSGQRPGARPQMHDSNGNGVDDRLERMRSVAGQRPQQQRPSRPMAGTRQANSMYRPMSGGWMGPDINDPLANGPVSVTQQWDQPSFTPGGGPGNFAYAQPDKRPQPFEQSMTFMGRPVDPGQYYGQRDAFIQNINDARQQFALNPTAGRPEMDFDKMWGNAGDMVQQGWQNPLQGLMGQGRMMSADAWEGMYPGQPTPGRPQSNGWML